jgi:glycosyltransferase involved in cell wall biosynthesis
MISVIIRTIGRPTLNHAIKSALNEFDKVIVVADAVDLDFSELPSGVTYLKTGYRHDKYGSLALNMGAYACTTEYFCLLDDDDEFVEGAGDFMRKFVSNNSDVDVFIPGINFVNKGFQLCMSPDKGLVVGNVAVPTYRTSWLAKVHMNRDLSDMFQLKEDFVDFAHVLACKTLGAKVMWYEKVLYNIRPHLAGTNGRGK